MLLRISVVSLSRRWISVIMSAGSRRVASSLVVGFLTERSKVVWSTSAALIVQELGLSALVFCRVINSFRSAIVSGLVLPRLRPGLSW